MWLDTSLALMPATNARVLTDPSFARPADATRGTFDESNMQDDRYLEAPIP
jgi:hypothetical protein